MAIKALREVAIDGIYEYLDEQIDTRNVISSILLKYKQHSEWFHRKRLRDIADDGLEGIKGERGLARDLDEYVFNQHVEFIIEPRSSTGEADLILREPGGRYLVIGYHQGRTCISSNGIARGTFRRQAMAPRSGDAPKAFVERVGHRVDGIIGVEIFRRYGVEIDSCQHTVRVTEPGAFADAGAGKAAES